MAHTGKDTSAAVTPITRGSGDELVGETPSAWRRLLARPDVVLDKGRLTLLNSTLPPRAAMIADLLFVREALIRGGVQFLLVRDSDSRPVLVVDEAHRAAATDALVLAASTEPLYAKAVDRKTGPSLFLADGRLSTSKKSQVFSIFRPRIEPRGGLRNGAPNGVRLEFWAFGATEIEAARETAMTRLTIPAEELAEASVELYGVRWRTIERMHARLASDVTFDIDMVFSWVDGTDVEFQRARARRMRSYVVGEGDDHAARFRQIDELQYALRSVYMFAPWIRRIFVVTDSPRPAWLADHPRVTVVRSEEIFVDPSVLPTHNSQAVESQLHRIPGLAEHFLYSNDDMFFGREVTPAMFFSPGGVTRFVEADTRIGLGSSNAVRSGFENAARVNRTIIERRFGATITRHLEHSAVPMRKSVMAELEREFPEDFARTAASAFRTQTDISVTNSLYHYFALLTGRAVTQDHARVKYVDTTTRAGLELMESLLAKRSYDMFCLNDGSFPEVSDEERAHAVRSFLERYFAIVAPWEQSTARSDVQVG
ncbi:MAG: stealth family protein [Rhodoglobus sp.]